MRIATIVLLLLSSICLSQTPAKPQTQDIVESVFVDMVDLYLTATDKKGRFITDLRPDELTIREDGVSQSITQFGHFAGNDAEVPLLLALVIDNSASMDEEIEEIKKLDLVRDTGKLLIQELGPLDRVMLVQFDEKPRATELTINKADVVKPLQEMRPRFRHTALFDALVFTIDELEKHPGRKVLLLCSDGLDNMSTTKLDDVLKKAKAVPELSFIVLGTVATDVNLFVYKTVRKEPPKRFLKGRDNLKTLAEQTGGYAFFPKSLKEVEEVRERLRSFVLSQYSIGYRSSNRNRDGSWRNITITCKRKDVVLRYRNGYFAT